MKRRGSGALAVWDGTADMLVRAWPRLLPPYCLACLPFAAAALATLDACLAGRADQLPWLCLCLTATGFVRWIGGALVQRRAMSVLDGGLGQENETKNGAFWLTYCSLRMRFYPLLAGPAALEGGGATKAYERTRRTAALAGGLFRRVVLWGTVFWGVGVVQVVALQYFLVSVVLPALLGWSDPLASAVLFNRFWLLALLLFSLLAFEWLALIAAAVAYRLGASRWTGADLAARVRAAADGGAKP